MRNVTVLTTRDGLVWLICIPELGCVSAARSRTEVRESARELAAVWLNVPPHLINVGRIRYLAIPAVQLVDRLASRHARAAGSTLEG
ncbi:type II toxin-antitoxin system HicB family antitoxin [Microbacteriaceae bacterium VKM Ac-2854]|nr:type II toxin-antitoxin system HicB family antitoxin [Microbacteriaceae bacterium VKM Ac-2854]